MILISLISYSTSSLLSMGAITNSHIEYMSNKYLYS